MDINAVFSEIERLADKYVEFLRNICDIESPTDYKKGVDAVGAYCVKLAESFGWTIEYQREKISGNAISITMNPELDTPAVVGYGSPDRLLWLPSDEDRGQFDKGPRRC